MIAPLRRAVAVAVLVLGCALPLAACDSDPPTDPGKPMTSADLAKLGCC